MAIFDYKTHSDSKIPNFFPNFPKIRVGTSFGNGRFPKIRVGTSFSSFFRTRPDSRKLVPTRNSTRMFGKKIGMQGPTSDLKCTAVIAQNWKQMIMSMDDITTVSSQMKNLNNFQKIFKSESTSHKFCDVVLSQKSCNDITSQSN